MQVGIGAMIVSGSWDFGLSKQKGTPEIRGGLQSICKIFLDTSYVFSNFVFVVYHSMYVTCTYV